MLVITCVSGAYAYGMKGEGFFLFRSSNFRLPSGLHDWQTDTIDFLIDV